MKNNITFLENLEKGEKEKRLSERDWFAEELHRLLEHEEGRKKFLWVAELAKKLFLVKNHNEEFKKDYRYLSIVNFFLRRSEAFKRFKRIKENCSFLLSKLEWEILQGMVLVTLGNEESLFGELLKDCRELDTRNEVIEKIMKGFRLGELSEIERIIDQRITEIVCSNFFDMPVGKKIKTSLTFTEHLEKGLPCFNTRFSGTLQYLDDKPLLSKRSRFAEEFHRLLEQEDGYERYLWLKHLGDRLYSGICDDIKKDRECLLSPRRTEDFFFCRHAALEGYEHIKENYYELLTPFEWEILHLTMKMPNDKIFLEILRDYCGILNTEDEVIDALAITYNGVTRGEIASRITEVVCFGSFETTEKDKEKEKILY